MSTIRLSQTTTLTPDQYIAGLTESGPGRSKVFGSSADDYLKIHDVGPAEADVTEDPGGVWERLHYDWSNPDRLRSPGGRDEQTDLVTRDAQLHAITRWGIPDPSKLARLQAITQPVLVANHSAYQMTTLGFMSSR